MSVGAEGRLAAYNEAAKIQARVDACDWLTDRKRGLGGTDIAAIAGVHPYRTPLDVYLDKTGEGLALGIGQFEMNEAVEWGNLLEPVIAERYERGHDLTLENPETSLVHSSREWHRGTPDRLKGVDGRGVEIKTAGVRQSHRWGDVGTDDVPVEYLIQCQWYMDLLDLPAWDLVVLLGGQEYREYTIERNQKLLHKLVALGLHFWNSQVLLKTAPTLDGSASSKEYLNALYPKHTDEVIEGDPEFDALALELCDLMGQEKHLKGQIDTAKTRILERMKTAGKAKGEWGSIGYKAEKGRVGWKAMAVELGATEEMENRFRAGSNRVLRPHWRK